MHPFGDRRTPRLPADFLPIDSTVSASRSSNRGAEPSGAGTRSEDDPDAPETRRASAEETERVRARHHLGDGRPATDSGWFEIAVIVVTALLILGAVIVTYF